MRVLLDTNILIHREAATVVRADIGLLFNWLDRLNYEKCVHPLSLAEIEKHDDPRTRTSFRAKLASYRPIQFPAPLRPDVQAVGAKLDSTENDRVDTALINELAAGRVDYLLSEDRGIGRKAVLLGVSDRVFTIDAFLEKSAAENPALVDYSVLAVRRVRFGEVDVTLSFFDSFREDYPDFDAWFGRKSDEPAYVCYEGRALVAFLYLKLEGDREPYPDITPQMRPAKRLKIGTFKVQLNGFKLGERFLKVIFDNALRQRVDEIYVTIVPRGVERERLIKLLEDFGFVKFGTKHGPGPDELVFVRDMAPAFNSSEPARTFPFASRRSRWFIVPIYPEYHTDLLPDSILKTESPAAFVEQQPHRNAIRKVYVSRSLFRDLRPGDIVVFYRTGGYHRSVVTTLGIVDAVRKEIRDEAHFIALCRQRSVFSSEQLKAQWNYRGGRPFIVDFLYAYSFPSRPNLKALIDEGVIADVESAPRGFEQLSPQKVEKILRLTNTDARLIVD